jgi:hypothetical protein
VQPQVRAALGEDRVQLTVALEQRHQHRCGHRAGDADALRLDRV